MRSKLFYNLRRYVVCMTWKSFLYRVPFIKNILVARVFSRVLNQKSFVPSGIVKLLEGKKEKFPQVHAAPFNFQLNSVKKPLKGAIVYMRGINSSRRILADIGFNLSASRSATFNPYFDSAYSSREFCWSNENMSAFSHVVLIPQKEGYALFVTGVAVPGGVGVACAPRAQLENKMAITNRRTAALILNSLRLLLSNRIVDHEDDF